MGCVFVLETFTSRDAGAEPTRMFLRRVSSTNTQPMSRATNNQRGYFKRVYFHNIIKKIIRQR